MFTFIVTRDTDVFSQAGFTYYVTGTGASPATQADFTSPLLGSLFFPIGQSSTYVSIGINRDAVVEPDEQFTLFVTNTGNTNVPLATFVATIQDSVPPLPTLRLSGSTSDREGNSGATAFLFTVTRSGINSGTSSVAYSVTGSGASAADFAGGVFPTGLLTFDPGVTTRTITVPILGDTVVEPNEAFTLTLSNPVNATLDGASIATTITNDDFTLLTFAGPGRKAEGDAGTTDFTFTITRTGDLSSSTSAKYETTVPSYQGAQPEDFALGAYPSGVVNFAPGETSKTLTIGIVGDTVPEFDETFIVRLFDATGPSVTIESGVLFTTIATEETPPTITLSGPSSVLEGDSGPTILTYTAIRTGDLSATSTIGYSTFTDPYASASVRHDWTTLFPFDFVDGQFPSGTLVFAPGETTKTFTVAIQGDHNVEPDGRLTIDLRAIAGASGFSKVTTTVLNDDVSFVGSSLGYRTTQTEGVPFSFKLDRQPGGQAATFSYSVRGAGASPADGADFVGGVLPTGTFTLGIGEVTKTVVIEVASDNAVEPDETFEFIITNATGETIPVPILTIVNDDGVALSAQPLGTAFSNILTTMNAADAAFVASLASQVTAGALTQTKALDQIVSRADGTTSVATLAYQFFTGKVPSEAGLAYLVSPTGPNPNNLNSAYYQGFSTENRYINFAVNLGKVGEGQQKFAAEYGGLDLAAATTKAYTAIFGTAPTAEKVQQLLTPSFTVGGRTVTRADYFAYYGGDGPNGVGTEAAMVGWLLAEAEKADIGMYSKANHAFLTDLADGATYAVDLIGTYGKPEFAI